MRFPISWLAQSNSWDEALPLPAEMSDADREAKRPRKLGPADRVIELYDAWREPLYRYVLTLGLAREAADDLVHDSFLKLHQHLSGGGRDENLRAWLFRVAHNAAMTQRRRVTELPVEESQLVALADARRSRAADPEQQLLHQEWRQRMRQALRNLPEQQRRCMHLRAEGLRYREIADILGMPVSTVAIQLQRAMARLAEECGD